MTIQATPAAATSAATTETATEAEVSLEGTTDERAEALKAKLGTAPTEPAVETPAKPDVLKPDGEAKDKPADATDAENDPAAKAREARAARQARIEEMRAKERAADEERQKRQKHRQSEGEIEKLRARVAELEAIESITKSPETLLEFAEKKGMSAAEITEWLRVRLTDPAALAKAQATTSEQKLAAQIAELEKKLEAERQAREGAATQAQAQAEAVQRGETFLKQIDEKLETHPLSAAFLKRWGPEGLIGLANRRVAPLFPEEYNYSLDELHDVMEQYLDEVQIAPGTNGTSAAPANGASHLPSKNGADKPVTTLSNRATQERATVTEEIPLEQLSLDERAEVLKQRLNAKSR